MKKEHELVYYYLTQSAKQIRERNKGLSKEDKRRAAVCLAIAWKMIWSHPRLSEKQIRLMITREYLHWL